MIKWNFPILRKIASKYKELGPLKFAAWFLFVWVGIKILVINIIAILFFGAEPFPIIRELLSQMEALGDYYVDIILKEQLYFL